MEQKSILFVGGDQGEWSNVLLLLYLAGFSVTSVPALEEAIDWVWIWRQMGMPYDLLILPGGFRATPGSVQILLDSIMVLCVDAGGYPSASGKYRLSSCRREELLVRAKEMLSES